jgi:hypothetical protein
MSNTPPPNFVNDTQYKVVPRRRFERRSVNDPQGIKRRLAAENEDMKMHKVDRRHTEFLREDERRQSARRSSRPTLLGVQQISKLSKKTELEAKI